MCYERNFESSPSPTLRVRAISSSNGRKKCTHVHTDNVYAVRCPSLVHEKQIRDRHLADCLSNTACKARQDVRAPEISSCTHLSLPDRSGETNGRAEQVYDTASKLQSEWYKQDASKGKTGGVQAEAPSIVLNLKAMGNRVSICLRQNGYE
jgi:hypothetical protein